MSRDSLIRIVRERRGLSLVDSSLKFGTQYPFIMLSMFSGTIEERVMDALPPNLQGRCKQFFAKYGQVFESVMQTDALQRLKKVKQFGVKVNTVSVSNGRAGTYDSFPMLCLHTRWDHVSLATSNMITAGILLGFSLRRTAQAAMATLLHDTAHPAFSHDGEKVLVRNGHSDHEASVVALLRNNQEICSILRKGRINLDRVLEIINEQGPVGCVQSVIDTLTWVIHDSASVNDPVPEDFCSRVLGSFCGMKQSHLEVDDLGPLQELLEYRARLFQTLFKDRRNMVAEVMLVAVLSFAIKNKFLKAETIKRGTDEDVERSLARMFAFRMNNVPRHLWSACAITAGYSDELESSWIMKSYNPDEPEAKRLLALKKESWELPFVIKPWDYTGKRIVVCDTDGTIHMLRASRDNLSLASRQVHVLDFRS